MNWLDTQPPRLAAQFAFLIEIDRLKNVLRATRNLHNRQPENSPEQQHHAALDDHITRQKRKAEHAQKIR